LKRHNRDKSFLRLPLEGSEAEAPPVAGEARRRRLAKRTVRTAESNATIEPDGIAVDDVD
jgi:hypothetical protein